MMTISKPWAAKGVALYPPNFCMVGQNQVFNALHQFRRSFWDGTGTDIAGFFVAFGDWGLGKTRLGYELIAEATGRVDEWLLNRHEHIIAPFHRADTKARVLEPALKDGILPLYIRYSSVCDEDLDAEGWVARLAVEALREIVDPTAKAGGTREIYADLQNVLHAKGVNLSALNILRDSARTYDDRLNVAMAVLRDAGVTHLWVVVDEVETPGDLKRGLREDTPTRVDDEYLLMVSEVVKHENWRSRHPYVNFILLCSLGMRDQIHIGPNLRRASSVTIEPNQVTDVRRYIDHIRASLVSPASVNYPIGTLEGAFLAANRNFGWLNVLMASIHETFVRHVERGEAIESWALIRDFAKTDARAKHIFNDQAVLPLIGNVAGVPKQEIDRLIYGQLPVAVGGTSPAAISPQMTQALLQHEIAGRGLAFAELVQIHIDERTLADELTQPDLGFRAKEGRTDTYFTANCELSVVGLLEALRAFSVSLGNKGGIDTGDFVIYADLDQWVEQLTALYPREGIEFAAEALHRVFTKPSYRVEGARFVGMSFKLWREFNRLLIAATETVHFFKDGKHEPALDKYVLEQSQTKQKRASAVCLGLAKLLDERLEESKQTPGLRDIPHQTFNSGFLSPSFDGLRVTPDGRVTIAYGMDVDQTVDRLKAFVALERVHPILVLFPPTADVSAFDSLVDAIPALKRCVFTRRLVSQEEEFLIKYSGRGVAFDPQIARLSKTANGLLKTYQDDWQTRTRDWASGLRRNGYLLAPIWSNPRAVNAADFAKGYRHMLAQNCSLDATHEDHGGPLNDVEFENCRQAAKKNIDPPAAWKYGDLLALLTTDGSNKPTVPACFLALLQELRTQSAATTVVKKFFFAVPDSAMKAVQQLDQILELLRGIGVVRKSGDLYHAVDQNLLDARRQSASNWLRNECKGLIKDLEGLFPTQANILLQAAYPEASGKLAEAEAKIRAIDFSVVATATVDPQSEKAFRSLVEQIAEAERLILGVCPLEIGEQSLEPFDCSPVSIPAYEARFGGLSLWRKVSFLGWLKKTFLATRDDLIQEIDSLLVDAAAMEVAEGEPFPIVPLTLPLKAIKSELENAIKGPASGSVTRMATIPVANFTLLIDQYLVNSQYDAAWKRMDALRTLVSRDRPESFFTKFKKLYERWAGVVRDFRRAETAWLALAGFIADAPPAVVEKVSGTKSTVQKYTVLIKGGLKQQIQSECEDLPEADLLDRLATEVNATSGLVPNLDTEVRAHHEEALRHLRAIIQKEALRALNRALSANGRPPKAEPAPGMTYKNTKLAYEAFNGEVAQEGRALFENGGKETHWSLWVEICAGLEAGAYDEDQHPDHSDAIRELKGMKLIRSKLELR
jgi:hypothetical protein